MKKLYIISYYNMKIVVFDLDETLGYFTQYGIFWECLKKYVQNKTTIELTQLDFDEILDLYPQFIRPNIINILKYLKKKKQSTCCHKMMIYTNNNGSTEWIQHIINYFEKKINYKLIDQIILAFKINGERVEICRTTHNKTHDDFIKCTKLPLNAKICFLDDTMYNEMINDNIYYINVKPYYYSLSFEKMIKIFKESNKYKKIINENDSEFDEIMLKNIELYHYQFFEKDVKEYELDKIIGKYILKHLYDFFNESSKNKTVK